MPDPLGMPAFVLFMLSWYRAALGLRNGGAKEQPKINIGRELREEQTTPRVCEGGEARSPLVKRRRLPSTREPLKHISPAVSSQSGTQVKNLR